MQKEIAKNAYELMRELFSTSAQYEVVTRSNIPSTRNSHVQKSLAALDGAVRFWSNHYSFESPIEFICVDESGKDFLFSELKRLNFLDAMPKDDKWNNDTKHTLFGSGGSSIVNGKTVLLYWQVSGTSNNFSGTGELKTPPHLFTHAAQSVIMSEAGYTITDLPGWFVEGQSDFIGLMSISETFEDYWKHRSNFFRTAYVPGGQSSREKMLRYSKEDWEKSLYDSPEKFAGIPLVDEYYSGLLAYEVLLYLAKRDNIKNINKVLLNGKDFYDMVLDHSGLDKRSFCKYSSELLAELAAEINAK
jgi:hypothetical protein